MKLAIIADDLTGANDSGVQLARHGFKTAVLFDKEENEVAEYEAVVFDTDSRSIGREEAYKKVREAAEFLNQVGFKNIFKKLDSTLRGNIGSEIDAIYDVMKPDFVMIAPGYPKNNRTIIQSMHYLDGIPLGESEIARDPKTPVMKSYVPDIISEQSLHDIGVITVDELSLGEFYIKEKMNEFHRQKIPYIVVDSEQESHLEQILKYTKKLPYRFVWVGSAGIANYLPSYYSVPGKNPDLVIPENNSPTLTVVGSINPNSREQLQILLDSGDIQAVSFESYKAVAGDEERKDEIRRVYKEASAIASEGNDVVIYSTGSKKDIEKAWEVGGANGIDHKEISNEIVKAIGAVCSVLLEDGYFRGVMMTGGDTAKQICKLWDVKGFELLDELEIGVPISKFIGISDLYVMTKAGGFGTKEVFMKGIQRLKGRK